MLRKNYVWILLLLSIAVSHAQKLKIKKDDILLDNQKVGFLKHIKVKGVGSYYEIWDNEGTHLFNAKMVIRESRFFGNTWPITYYTMECVKEQDSIGIGKKGFWLGKKQIGKYLLETNILGKNGFDDNRVKEMLEQTNSIPDYALEKIENDNRLTQDFGHQVIRDKTLPIFVERLETQGAISLMEPALVTQTKFIIYQGEDIDNKQTIGFAYIEKTMEERVRLIMANIRECPIAYFNNWKYFTFYPLTELETDFRNIKKLGTPIEAIYQFCDMLIANDKL